MDPKSVNRTNIFSLLCLHSAKLGFQRLFFYSHKIFFHSIFSGGSTTIHKTHRPNSTIKIIGRWRLNDFLIYLQVQVATFTKGVATDMKKKLLVSPLVRPSV